MNNWFYLVAFCFLFSSLNAQQTVQVQLTFPSNLKLDRLWVKFNNGKNTESISIDTSKQSLEFQSELFAVYGIVDVYYPSQNPDKPHLKSFLVQATLPATINFQDSDLPLETVELLNAKDLEEEGKRVGKEWIKPYINDLQAFFSNNSRAIEEGHDSITQVVNEKFLAINRKSLEFIQAHPNSYYSFLVFKDEVIKSKLDPDSLAIFFQQTFSKEIKESWPGQRVATFLAGKRLKKGDPMPAISAVDILGNEVSLESYRGKKHVLLIFWATWCQFCMAEVPDMKFIYEMYNPKGLEVISVSHDYNKNALLKKLEQSQLNWTHLFNQPEVSHKLAITEVPSFLLIDPQGNIVFKEEGFRKDRMEELQSILQETF